MVASQQLTPGMAISINKKLYRIESVVKVSAPKGAPFMKVELRDLLTNKLEKKNFKPTQIVKEVSLDERDLEFLYIEGKDYLFLDTDSLDKVLIPHQIVGSSSSYLKEGVCLKGLYFGDTVFGVQLPQFLELMVSQIEGEEEMGRVSNQQKEAVLETGAKVVVPFFIEVGDIVKVDTSSHEFIQRV
ncbi:MAG: elongation factor P [Waddliaceae bacterium]